MKQTIAFLTCLLCLTGLTAAQAQEKTSFCFAQITDTHLTRRNPAKTEDLLRSVAQINATDGIDFVLVTGDLSNEGDSIGLGPGAGKRLRGPGLCFPEFRNSRNGFTPDNCSRKARGPGLYVKNKTLAFPCGKNFRNRNNPLFLQP